VVGNLFVLLGHIHKLKSPWDKKWKFYILKLLLTMKKKYYLKFKNNKMYKKNFRSRI